MLKITISGNRSAGRTVDKLNIPISCIDCGHEFEKPLSELKGDPIIPCPSCGKQFKIDTAGTASEMIDGLNNLDRAIDNFGK